MTCAPQREAKAAHKLGMAGIEVQYAVEERVRHHNGKKREYTVPKLPRIIYGRFTRAPNWDVIKERRIITGVFSLRGIPVIVPDETVREIMGLPLEEERLERERIAAMTPNDGEQVQLSLGPLAGFLVDVERVEQGRVWYRYISDIGPVRGEASIDGVQRLARDG